MADVELQEVITDSQLKMIFACCHPAVSVEYQLVLSLKLIGGFGNREIARALLKKEETVAKSFTRARKKLKDAVSTLEIPVELGLQSRLTSVLKVVYLFFSEGYAASSGEMGIKKDFCLEAIRLAVLLGENKYCNHPDVHALIALMCFHTSRFDARVSASGELVDLEHQDRSRYDRDLIRLGAEHLEQASRAVYHPSNYHLEAAVSYYHCLAPAFEHTRWDQILHLYDLQLQRVYSPVVALNRIVPYHTVHGPQAAMEELRQMEKDPRFSATALYYAIHSELLQDLGNLADAGEALEKAIALNRNALEKKHLQRKLKALKEQLK
jgi:RNA polymerase sigma-70 factor (ECF subfamily)